MKTEKGKVIKKFIEICRDWEIDKDVIKEKVGEMKVI